MSGRSLRGMAAAFLLVVPVVDAAGPGADRKAPTTPTNLAVTGKTAYSVSFSWGAAGVVVSRRSVVETELLGLDPFPAASTAAT